VEAPQSSPPLRIVSLSPALTRTLVDVGVVGSVPAAGAAGADDERETAARLVGRTPFCDAADPSVPAIGSLLDLDYERLIRADPTHILVQPPVAGLDPELVRLAARRGWAVESFRLDDLADIEAMLARLGDALGPGLPKPSAERLGRAISDRIAAISALRQAAAVERLDGERVVLLVGIDPLVAVGRGTFLSSILTAGGRVNAIAASGYPELTMEDLVGIHPAAILLIRELPPSPAEEQRLLAPLRQAATPASRSGRVGLMVDPDAMLPSSVAPEVAGRLDRALDASGSGAVR
jgi:ABC-type Fe3+-hydroxamate transport system substrate-binding protein